MGSCVYATPPARSTATVRSVVAMGWRMKSRDGFTAALCACNYGSAARRRRHGRIEGDHAPDVKKCEAPTRPIWPDGRHEDRPVCPDHARRTLGYPKDDTRGCTRGACDFGDALPDFTKGKAPAAPAARRFGVSCWG